MIYKDGNEYAILGPQTLRPVSWKVDRQPAAGHLNIISIDLTDEGVLPSSAFQWEGDEGTLFPSPCGHFEFEQGEGAVRVETKSAYRKLSDEGKQSAWPLLFSIESVLQPGASIRKTAPPEWLVLQGGDFVLEERWDEKLRQETWVYHPVVASVRWPSPLSDSVQPVVLLPAVSGRLWALVDWREINPVLECGNKEGKTEYCPVFAVEDGSSGWQFVIRVGAVVKDGNGWFCFADEMRQECVASQNQEKGKGRPWRGIEGAFSVFESGEGPSQSQRKAPESSLTVSEKVDVDRGEVVGKGKVRYYVQQADGWHVRGPLPESSKRRKMIQKKDGSLVLKRKCGFASEYPVVWNPWAWAWFIHRPKGPVIIRPSRGQGTGGAATGWGVR
uniref:Uncharacterized protein n=1 Tax=Chromera velia CCMP2878 TaxID=1169474 RepID=A0A0G4H8E6_9ALVE|eukprot:Cvel_5882.t1-p1 / transcript=Cvel_5882.t1 / gene=Cvel_5882 / organism=Chromera_velia_CCMP2878 / gene_product=hypothetical protein / transcript_product=hypothetical protein / location=Cvel_scaffold280:46629-47786(+) / protein_length=386 / sequence_SO=supercontig / SO=protein_coding / is_pseudo=false